MYRVAQRATEILLAAIDGMDGPANETLPTEFVVRGHRVKTHLPKALRPTRFPESTGPTQFREMIRDGTVRRRRVGLDRGCPGLDIEA